METDQVIPVPLLREDVQYLMGMARMIGMNVPELMRSVIETLIEDDRQAEEDGNIAHTLLQPDLTPDARPSLYIVGGYGSPSEQGEV